MIEVKERSGGLPNWELFPKIETPGWGLFPNRAFRSERESGFLCQRHDCLFQDSPQLVTALFNSVADKVSADSE